MVDVLLELPGPEPRTVKLSSPDKVLWPDAPGGAVTKRGLADYLIAVSEPFLRLNGDRPMTLQRFPDGVDGEEEIAGACLSPDSLARAWDKGIRPKDALANNDGHGFFSALGDSIVTGPTLTNVNDFRAILIQDEGKAWR